MKALLAGNYRQANNYLKSLSPSNRKDYIYISRFEAAVGMIFSGYIIVGTFWERKDSDKLWNYVVTHKRDKGFNEEE
jgi:hypothetical protein